MSATLQQIQRQNERLIREFVEKQNGVFLVLSDDSGFVTTIRAAVYKHLALKAGSVRSFNNRERFKQEIKDLIKGQNRILVLLEREVESQSNIDLVKVMRKNVPSAMQLVLTTEMDRDKLILFLEEGAAGCITKPISVNNLVEKIAGAIKPPSKLAELIENGKAALRTKHFEQALKAAAKVLEMKPDSPAGLMLRGDALKSLGRRKEALVAYRAASDIAEMYLEPIKKLAEFYNEEGDQIRELDCLTQLDQLSPLNSERKMSIGMINADMGNFDKAEEAFDQAIKLSQREAKAMVSQISKRIGDTMMAKSPNLAAKYLTQSLKLKRTMINRSDVETFNTLGIALRQQGKWQEAVRNYQMALRVAPDETNLHYNLGLALFEGEQFPEAAESMERALTLKPDLTADNATASFNVGIAFYRAERLKEAWVHLRRTVELSPTNTEAVTLLKAIRQALADAAKAAQEAAAQQAAKPAAVPAK